MNFIDKQCNYLSEQWFGWCDDFNDGFAAVELNGRMNSIDKQGNYLSDQWFDYCWNFYEGFAKVRLNGKYNFIDKQCNYLSDQWFDVCYSFNGGFAKVKLNGKSYKILPLAHPRQIGALGGHSESWYNEHKKWEERMYNGGTVLLL